MPSPLPQIGEWFTYRPTRGRSIRVKCIGFRGQTIGKKGWIETVCEGGFHRSVAPAHYTPDDGAEL